ncbi:hypothetical protein COU20_01480 [Candidatus Kaiserbacteria bacterium CG10_big_fil_rev_8_21_14_0_10_59_10]|uniref:PKD/Chitinase domain-containing protein n=1 Tax=Candidatus Kaiserbacteria bacterium CG10_big_fil_rev_8_21_14_0_10_59_10 TaxID=1974612 RepID=A0A2H0U871_9BACT|nr:MAG: hypothetical protein COU20_01480 [Candidatus Kaiserbacteria bacterium CG10_big_fil_rev_8_21_14_0_10_59_10]
MHLPFLSVVVLSLAFASVAFAQSTVNIRVEAGASAGTGASSTKVSEVKMEIETIEMRARAGESFILDGTRSSDDGVARTFIWTQVSGPFRFETREGARASFTPTVPGMYVFELRTGEGDSARVEKRVEVSVSTGNRTTDTQKEADSGETRQNLPLADGVAPVLMSSIFKEDGIAIRSGSFQDADRNGGLDRSRASTGGDAESDVRAIAELVVTGRTVRGWNPEKKEAISARASVLEKVESAEDFGVYVASVAIEREDIEEIVVAEDHVEIAFSAPVKFLGFIPFAVTARARAGAEMQTSVRYPWYAFLATKTGTHGTAATTFATRIKALYDSNTDRIQGAVLQ